MITPWLKGFLSWRQAPLTWTLILLNLLIFLHTFENTRLNVSRDFSSGEMMVFTGKLYHQFKNPKENEIPFASRNEWLLQGSQALRDPDFIGQAVNHRFFGDPIAIQQWRDKIRQYQKRLNERSTFVFGLRSGASPLTWVTYQFMHASWMHLIGNMLMLLIFGAALETTIGSLGLIFVYLLSGFAGGFAFQFLGGPSLAAMVGASGALSGLMAFYAAFEKKKRISYFYFVSPIEGYYGWIYLPTLLIFPLSFLGDLAGYLSTPVEIGTGIAYTAHLGGAILGGLLGFSLRFFRRNIWLQWFFQH